MQAPPSLSTDSVSAFLKGLVAVEDRMVMVLSLDNLAADTRHVVMAEAACRTSAVLRTKQHRRNSTKGRKMGTRVLDRDDSRAEAHTAQLPYLKRRTYHVLSLHNKKQLESSIMTS